MDKMVPTVADIEAVTDPNDRRALLRLRRAMLKNRAALVSIRGEQVVAAEEACYAAMTPEERERDLRRCIDRIDTGIDLDQLRKVLD